MNKEDKYEYVFPLPVWIARFIANLHLSAQALVQKEGK